jgi:hypothetical protein
MIVVADTSPLNYLILIGQIEILPYFNQQILIPPFVWGGTAGCRHAWSSQGMGSSVT